jgi:hypothetical protein
MVINNHHIIIISFDNYIKYETSISSISWSRVIVDEFHEIYASLKPFKTIYKWISTATPFINSDMILNIFNFIAFKPIDDMRV